MYLKEAGYNDEQYIWLSVVTSDPGYCEHSNEPSDSIKDGELP
jgi:hypothetical protein